MEARFNVTKEDRKALVAAVSEITNVKAEYQGAPGFVFAVGGSIIDKSGTITFDVQMSAEDVRSLLTALTERALRSRAILTRSRPELYMPEPRWMGTLLLNPRLAERRLSRLPTRW